MGFSFSATYIAVWVAVVLQGVLILALLQRLEKLRQIMERGRSPSEKLPIGSSAPQFSAIDWSGKQASLQDFAGEEGILLFLSPTCYVCKDFVDSIASAKDELPPVIAFCVGEQEGCGAFSKRLVPLVRFLDTHTREFCACCR
jgi:cytochrome oxidase Cu insertion factor (SCO1/SenC/PrrC family)